MRTKSGLGPQNGAWTYLPYPLIGVPASKKKSVPSVYSINYRNKKNVVLGWRALRPPRVVFVLGFVSLINFLTSGKILGGTVHGFTFWDRSQIHCGHTFILSRVSKHKGEFDLEPFFKRDLSAPGFRPHICSLTPLDTLFGSSQ